VSDLVEFLRQRLDEDERTARIVNADPTSDCWFDCAGDGHGDHHLRWNPARVLAEVDAKRRILDEHAPFSQPQKMAWGEIIACSTCGSVDDSPTEWPCSTVRLMALPYADHPDYREEWRPE